MSLLDNVSTADLVKLETLLTPHVSNEDSPRGIPELLQWIQDELAKRRGYVPPAE